VELSGDPPRTIASEAHLGLARIYYEWNDLDAAHQHGQQCLQLTRQIEGVDTFASYAVFLARMRLAQGDIPSAITIVDEAEAFLRQHNFLFRMRDIAAARVLILLRLGDLRAAARLADVDQLPLSQARVYLAQGDTSAALAVLAPWRKQVEAKAWADERLKVMILQALALQANGDTETAVRILGEALAFAKKGGFVRSFVDEGRPMAELLSAASAHLRMPVYVTKLLTQFEIETQHETPRRPVMRAHLSASH
jgi:LuxR family transcriptional regulator, maltose regulon positive regulatory protein